MRILAISGSLRAVSSNTAALEAAALLAPAGCEVVLYDGLAGIPPFNPDLDAEGMEPPAPVAALRRAVGEAHAVLVSAPEYAHGMPGALKNALDWLVSSAELPDTPLALINTAPRARHAQEQLREVLTTMSARLIDAACITLPLSGQPADAAAIAADPGLAGPLRQAVQALADAPARQVI